MKHRPLFVAAVLAAAASLLLASFAAAAPSPFTGHWTAVDVDDSNMHLSISGGGNGVFHLSWHDDHWGLCEGEPGLGMGTGVLDGSDPYLLHTQWTLRCLTQGSALQRDFDATYDPATDSLRFPLGDYSVTWTRIGH
jgi:hypothetical protein